MHAKKTTRLFIFLLTCLLLAVTTAFSIPQSVNAQNENKVVLVFIWGNGCPHCAAEREFLASMEQIYPNLEVRTYEVYYTEGNLDIMDKLAVGNGFEAAGVPIAIVGDKNWIGFSESYGREIEEAIKTCSVEACKDPAEGILSAEEIAAGVPLAQIQEEFGSSSEASQPTEPTTSETNESFGVYTLFIPLIGQVDLEKQSLAIATLLIAFVDGVNPCSIWALTMLLAITLHTGSRKKVMIIGIVFIFVTAMIYGLFILGIFSALTLLSSLGWIQIIVSLVALFFAIINIKDYFWYKEGLSFTISDDSKPGLFQKMRKVVDASDSFWGLVGATVVLAAGVSLVEFACTAGFPVVWTNLLSAHQVTPATFILLLLLYLAIYQLDEFAIFITAVVTLKSSKMEEKHGRILKLIGGTLMLSLAIAMLIDPFIMNRLSSSLLVFGAAIVFMLLILLIHRRILPAMGIYIGTEMKSAAKSRRKRS